MNTLKKTLLSSSIALLAACQTMDQIANEPAPGPSNPSAGLSMGFGEEARKAYIDELDRDGDGKVSRAEVEQFRIERFQIADANNDGQVSVAEYVDEYAGRLERRIENERTSHVEQTRTRFKSLDKNNDGSVSWEEYKASGDRAFVRFDPENSGRVIATESHGEPEPRTRQHSVLGMPTTHSMAGFLELYDEDADGVVTRQQFDDLRRGAYDATDTDGNGVLSFEEYLIEFTDRVDRQADNVREQQLKQAKVRFGALDTDKDGFISLEEYIATGMRSFDNWDTNDDGFVSLDEPLPERPARQRQARAGESVGGAPADAAPATRR